MDSKLKKRFLILALIIEIVLITGTILGSVLLINYNIIYSIILLVCGILFSIYIITLHRVIFNLSGIKNSDQKDKKTNIEEQNK